jgi:hypothetical protein
MNYIANAFSLQMQMNHFCFSRVVDINEVKEAVSPYHQGNTERKEKYWGTGPLRFPAKSVIGHNDICNVINSALGLSGEAAYPVNREAIQLEVGDILYVGQYVGSRLPEGAKELPEGATITWYRVDCVKLDYTDLLEFKRNATRAIADYAHTCGCDKTTLDTWARSAAPQYFNEHAYD